MKATLGAEYVADCGKGSGAFDSESYIGAETESAIAERVNSPTTVPESDKFNLTLALINEAVANKAQQEALAIKTERESGNESVRTSRLRKAGRSVLGKFIRR